MRNEAEKDKLPQDDPNLKVRDQSILVMVDRVS
jgi:hypothetical protein